MTVAYFKRKKGSKYNNTKCEYKDLQFDSKGERSRYIELELLQKAKVIKKLDVQPKFEIFPGYKLNGKKIIAITYSPDFVYIEKGVLVYEDLKSEITALDKTYCMKKKMFMYKLLMMEIEDGVKRGFREQIR